MRPPRPRGGGGRVRLGTPPGLRVTPRFPLVPPRRIGPRAACPTLSPLFLDVGSPPIQTEPPSTSPLSKRPPSNSRGPPKPLPSVGVAGVGGGVASFTSHRGKTGDNEMRVWPHRRQPQTPLGLGGVILGFGGALPTHPVCCVTSLQPRWQFQCHQIATVTKARPRGIPQPGRGAAFWGGVHAPRPPGKHPPVTLATTPGVRRVEGPGGAQACPQPSLGTLKPPLEGQGGVLPQLGGAVG